MDICKGINQTSGLPCTKKSKDHKEYGHNDIYTGYCGMHVAQNSILAADRKERSRLARIAYEEERMTALRDAEEKRKKEMDERREALRKTIHDHIRGLNASQDLILDTIAVHDMISDAKKRLQTTSQTKSYVALSSVYGELLMAIDSAKGGALPFTVHLKALKHSVVFKNLLTSGALNSGDLLLYSNYYNAYIYNG